MSNNKISIYKKIQAISAEIKTIEKDLTVSTGTDKSYKAVSDFAVIQAVKKYEQKHGILSIPKNVELVSYNEIKAIKKDKYGEREIITHSFVVKLIMEVVDIETGESIEVTMHSQGLDNGDKAFGKASTYARKYALLNLYKIGTGEDPDQDASETLENELIDNKKIQVENFLLKNTSYQHNVLNHFSLSDISELKTEQIEAIYKQLQSKKLL